MGPIMVGPSSSHTAGMARIGLMANRIMGGAIPKNIEITLHPAIRYTYKGHRTDVALVGGILGLDEKSERLADALTLATQNGIDTRVGFFKDEKLNPNTVLLEMEMTDGISHTVLGISVGGGSIEIIEVDGVKLHLSPRKWNLFIWSNDDISQMISGHFQREVESGYCKGRFLSVMTFEKEPESGIQSKIMAMPSAAECSLTTPITPFGELSSESPPITSFKELLDLSVVTGKSTAELALEYERKRSEKSAKQIEDYMYTMLHAMKKAVDKGLNQENKLIYGLTSGKDAKKLLQAADECRTISRGIVPRAVAFALGVMEVNASAGEIVAAPTAGSAGIVPGCLLAMQKEYALTDHELVRALFVCALTGVIMLEKGVSFSGAVGGCQGEVGVSSAIAAAGMTAVFGGSTRQSVNAAAMAIKNILGLICDPIGGPVEVPCIKRNSIGVANAFIAADMALAGIESYIPPDEVLDALINVQKLLPPELRGRAIGGLACTRTAKAFRDSIAGISRSDYQ
ncbi:MAG: L-serine ammonia-lyase, iron-sulfur-dependent, subunit alpha [Oscillospiraceae bacterium]